MRGKPAGLVVRNETNGEKAVRKAREDSLRPGERRLPMYPPAMLKGNAAAQKVWRRVMRLYADVEAQIVTGLDQDLLIEYCTVVAEVEELNGLRAALADDMDALIKLDARVDRKRAHLHKLRESLYLTPRARAGVAPAAAQAEEPPDEMEQLLGEVVMFVNEGKG